MKLLDIYKLSVEAGKDADPRRGAEMDALLRRAKEAYDKLEQDERDRFDADSLWNPYADRRLLTGDPDAEIGGVMWGIDVSTGEAVLADRLREKGRKVDAVISHHPQGRARAALHKVMSVQENMMESWGVPITAAEWIMGPRMNEVKFGIHAGNHNQSVDACRLLDIPFMCIHTPADMLAQRFMENYLEEKRPERLKDLLKLLNELPEYAFSARNANPPDLLTGDKEKRVGKIAVKFSGGTSASKEIYEQLGRAGIGTAVVMHAPESHIEEAKKHKVSIVLASHMASDSLGNNLMADKIEANGVEVLPCSGFIRVRRT